MRKMSWLVAVLLASGVTSEALAAPKVMVSILPLHSLVAGVMQGVGQPELLLSGQNSEHQASFSPQQISMLGEADVVFMIGAGLELKLDEMSGSEAVKGKRFVEMAELPDLVKWQVREGGTWETHEDGHEHEHAEEAGHGTANFDPHVWLDPQNARVMVSAIAAELSKADPDNAQRYTENAQAVSARLTQLTEQISMELQPVGTKPFVVFHDAFQYFERRFALNGVGSISDLNANAPSAKRLSEVRKKLNDTGATCVFREPQFSDAAVSIVIEGSAARSGVLDPIGAGLTPGPDAYAALLKSVSANIKSCLAGN